jgi:hypothetical protein
MHTNTDNTGVDCRSLPATQSTRTKQKNRKRKRKKNNYFFFSFFLLTERCRRRLWWRRRWRRAASRAGVDGRHAEHKNQEHGQIHGYKHDDSKLKSRGVERKNNFSDGRNRMEPEFGQPTALRWVRVFGLFF